MIINEKEYKINRNTAHVTEWDKVYCELLKKILDEGEKFENRTGIDTLSIEGFNFKIHAGDTFPVLESKKVVLKNALSEILWIMQAQSNNVNWLEKRHNPIWKEWKIDADGIYRIYEPNTINYDKDKKVIVYDVDGNPKKDKNGNVIYALSLIENKNIKSAKYFGKEFAGTIGTAYGWINNKFERPQYVLTQLKNNPHDRRMIISLWQDEYLKTAVLPSCVWSSEWKVSQGKLHCYIHQRSADVPLGLPFNVSQYAMLQALFAKVSNLEIGNLNWSIMDAHIYVNQIDQIKLQLKRYELMTKMEEYILNHSDIEVEKEYLQLKKKELQETDSEKFKELQEQIRVFEFMITKTQSKLELADKDDFFKFDNEVNNDKEYLKVNTTGNEDIKVLKYSSLPFISIPVAQ